MNGGGGGPQMQPQVEDADGMRAFVVFLVCLSTLASLCWVLQQLTRQRQSVDSAIYAKLHSLGILWPAEQALQCQEASQHLQPSLRFFQGESYFSKVAQLLYRLLDHLLRTRGCLRMPDSDAAGGQ